MGKKQVMSHDPLAELDDVALGETIAVPVELQEAGDGAKADADEAVLRLPESLTIAEVAQCHAQWLDRLQRGAALVIDGGGVEQIDGAGLQLLTAFVKDGTASACGVRWSAYSEVLVNGARRLGLAGALGLDEEGQKASGGAR